MFWFFPALNSLLASMKRILPGVAVLLPHGVLFRGGAEEAIRKYIIKDLNRLDAVIGLPANLFHGTGCIVGHPQISYQLSTSSYTVDCKPVQSASNHHRIYHLSPL